MVVDYSQWDIYDGFSEGSGRSEKIWLTNHETKEIGLFKYTKSDRTTEHVSEKLASDLAGLLGLKCAKIEIGRYKSRIGSMSYLINDETEILIEGIYLINKNYPSYDSYTMYDNENKEYYSIEMILKSLAEYNLSNDFFRISIFDFLIGNTDRHQNNWAVLESDNGIRICPIYDNGSSLCCYFEEKNIDFYLGNDKVRFNSVVNSKSKSRIRVDKKIKKEPTHIEMLKYIKSNHSECVMDLIKVIDKKITEVSLDKIMFNYSEELISDRRKKLIKRFLIEKVKLMNDIFLGACRIQK
ncbi:HipA domain-containing protein [Clostridium sp.]|uniref:HipA domain-containing protein n=1 Tax=Clostridium sp. TaxID=1506 RepID=UPI002601CE92|nr:HipA domain-containing protein [uncultured Clostridium sp.]